MESKPVPLGQAAAALGVSSQLLRNCIRGKRGPGLRWCWLGRRAAVSIEEAREYLANHTEARPPAPPAAGRCRGSLEETWQAVFRDLHVMAGAKTAIDRALARVQRNLQHIEAQSQKGPEA